MTIGFVGLGLMGSRMAANLLEAGHSLFVYNRSAEKAQPLVERGATRVEAPDELGDSVDVVITMLSAPDAVAEMATGEHGFLQTLSENTLWIDCSTVNPGFSRTMAAFARARNLRFLDAPVAGTIGPAEAGELVFLVGGSDRDIGEAQPLFDVMGTKTVHVGEVSMGSSMKMVVNVMLGQSMAAFAEAVQFGESMGISQKQLFDTLIGGPVTAPFLKGKREKLENGDYEAQFPLEHMHKDLRLARNTASEHGMPMLSAGTTEELFQTARAQNMGRFDFSAIFKHMQHLSGRDT